MSKESYSQEIYTTLYQKIKTLEYKEPIYFFQHDEYFELALCLAYMTLSKEKIIKKEIKNNDRLGRLNKMVSTTDIDTLFDPSFNKEMPTVISSLESDNLWILDNFRDSIMHGVFDIDMENKCFIINNTQPNRRLNATIPFSWFVAYTKNDIFNKKVLDKYTIRGFFYNDFKSKQKDFNSYSEIFSHIMFEAVITGNKFKVNQVEDRIRELFELYKHETIDQETFDEYQTKLPRTKNKYNTKYLTTFAVVCDKVKAKLKEEYPDLDIKIFVKDKKHKIAKRLSRKLDETYHRYDSFIDTLNTLVSSRSKIELNYIANIIDNLTPVTEEQIKKLKEPNAMLLFNQLIEDKNLTYTGYHDERKRYQRNLEQARIICLTAFAISTLVINQESIYNDFYDNHAPMQYNITARAKQPLKDNLDKEKSLAIKRFKKLILLAEKNDQLSKCTKEDGKAKLTATIQKLTKEIEDLETDLTLLWDERQQHKEYTRTTSVEKTKRELEIIGQRLEKQIRNFYASSKKVDKEKILDSIDALYDDYITAELKDSYWTVDSMKEALTIIRNCFSHLERIYIGPDKKDKTIIILNDYDNDGTKSGEVITTYNTLISILLLPFREPSYVHTKLKKDC